MHNYKAFSILELLNEGVFLNPTYGSDFDSFLMKVCSLNNFQFIEFIFLHTKMINQIERHMHLFEQLKLFIITYSE